MAFDVYFTLGYLILTYVFLCEPTECVQLGLTLPELCARWLGNEQQTFVQYHINRTVLLMVALACLPLGYVAGIYMYGEENGLQDLWILGQLQISSILVTSVIILPLMAVLQVLKYGWDWSNHPIVLNLKKFCNSNTDWKTLASDVNAEFRSIDKICIATSTVCKIIVTENWIIKVTPLRMNIVHQSDCSLKMVKTDTHRLSHVNPGTEVQYVTIEVQNSRAGTFNIRLNSMDFKDLQDRVARRIVIPSDVKFHRDVIDKFVDAFKDVVKDNDVYVTDQELEQCAGCMQVTSNVKLQRLCGDASENSCRSCYCRPMWCVDCMARWFANRQDPEEIDRWLTLKCTCPMCRAPFCTLDVSMVSQ